MKRTATSATRQSKTLGAASLALSPSFEPAIENGGKTSFLKFLRATSFLPGGRILAGAGTGRRVTLFNCFVMGVIEDSLSGILSALSEGTLTLQQGGGVDDFSTLRPKGMRAKGGGAIASGPVSFMQVWDAMSETLMATGPRRAAIMGTLRCDHPDIELFIGAKREPGRLRHFNLSVQITDAFMAAVRSAADWPLIFPAAACSGEELVYRDWPGTPVQCRAMSCAPFLPAPCGRDFAHRLRDRGAGRALRRSHQRDEQPLVRRGKHDDEPLRRGSVAALRRVRSRLINLTQFIEQPFTERARLDATALTDTVVRPFAFSTTSSMSRAFRCRSIEKTRAARGG